MPKERTTSTTNRVAAVVYFGYGVSLEEAKKIVERMKEKDGVTASVVREYDPEIGSPVWYIP